MSLAKVLFVAIDKIFDFPQNKNSIFNLNNKEFIIENDIVYSDMDKDVCKLDIYYQNSDKQMPVFFYIHGGGFVAGDKHHRRGVAKWAASQGYFVVNVNYALSPQYLFPTPLKNLMEAVNWIEKNAKNYNIDINNMMVAGDSAGGYYAAVLAAVLNKNNIQEELGIKTNLKFRGAMLDCGVYDVGEILKKNMPFDLADKICFDFAGIHKQQFNIYEWKHICAPIDLVDEKFPKTFLTYAEKDMFCKGQGVNMVDKIKSKGIYVEEHHSTKFKDNHCYPLNWTTKSAKENLILAQSFMKRFKDKII